MSSNSKLIPDVFQFPSNDDWEGQIKALLHFLEVWHGKFNVEDRISAEDLNKIEIPIPKPLRMLYEFGGNSDKVLGFNNTILAPKNLEMHDNDKLEFYVDKHDILQWAVDITEENPKVYMKQEETLELSKFLRFEPIQ